MSLKFEPASEPQRRAQTTMLAGGGIAEMEGALAQSKSSGTGKSRVTGKSGTKARSTYAALMKDLDLSDELAGASLGGEKRAQAVIQARAQKQSLKGMKSMHFDIDSESQPPVAASARPVRYAAAAQKPVQALGSVAPFEYPLGADTSSPMQFGGDNVVRNSAPLGPASRTMPRALRWS